MDLRQLQAFLAVVDHGGFTAAAKATHTVQSNISTHVARLERDLDAILLDRATGRPTQEGEAVLVRVRRIQNELSSMEADVSSLRSSPRGLVRVGIIGTTARWLAPLLFSELKNAAPDIQLVVADGTTRTIEHRLLDGELDIGVISLPVDDPEVRTTPLFNEDHMVVCPNSHALASVHQSVDLPTLARYPLLLPSSNTPFRRELDNAFRSHGTRPIPQMELDGLRLIASMAFQGFGVAILPATATPGWLKGPWITIPLTGIPRRTVALATRRRGMLTVAAQTVEKVIDQIISHQAEHVEGLYLLQK